MEKPERIGIVSRMQPFEKMTASYLTEAVGNVVTNGTAKANKYQPLDSFSFE